MAESEENHYRGEASALGLVPYFVFSPGLLVSIGFTCRSVQSLPTRVVVISLQRVWFATTSFFSG